MQTLCGVVPSGVVCPRMQIDLSHLQAQRGEYIRVLLQAEPSWFRVHPPTPNSEPCACPPFQNILSPLMSPAPRPQSLNPNALSAPPFQNILAEMEEAPDADAKALVPQAGGGGGRG